jgi:hypothetical protein
MIDKIVMKNELNVALTQNFRRNGNMVNKGTKSLKVMMCSLVLVFNLVFFAQIALGAAGDITIPNDVTNAGSATTAASAASDIATQLNTWITNLRVIGAVAAIFGIVIGAILFSVSLGNSQRRGLAISSMLCAGGGIIIISKAHTIASYFIHGS